jgi:CubicO group peptidase (beta-lactamase class C family)
MGQGKSTYSQIQRIDSFIRKVKEVFPEIPGISVAIVKDQKTCLIKGYGYAELETKRKCTHHTPFYIASCTKSFTGLAAAILHTEEKVKLDEYVSSYFPSSFFTHPISVDSIQFRHLLTHTSGLENDPLTFRLAYSGDSDTEKAKSTLAGFTSRNRDIGVFEYSNVGYNIYTMAILEKYGIDWRDFLQVRIFDALGMKDTRVDVSKYAVGRNSPAVPYGFNRDTSIVPLYLSKLDNTMQSAGGVMSSAKDMARWLEVEMNLGIMGRKQVLPSESFKLQQTDYVRTNRQKPPFQGEGKYGLGLHIGTYLNNPVFYHFGGFPGFFTHFSFLPKKKIGIVVMTNEGLIGGEVAHLIATFTYQIMLGEDSVEFNFDEKLRALRESTTANLKSYVRSYEEKASRPWLISPNLIGYCGEFYSEAMGTMSITLEENELMLQIGNLKAIPLPYTEKESIRVELIPGRGEVITFLKNEEGIVVGLTYSDYTFNKTK